MAISGANPAKETRYQDIRLYGRALERPTKSKRLPFEDYVAEIVVEAILRNGRRSVARCRRVLPQQRRSTRSANSRIEIARLNAQLDQLSEGGDLTHGLVGEAFARLRQRADARHVCGAHGAGGGQHAALSARPARRLSRTTGWRWRSGR